MDPKERSDIIEEALNKVLDDVKDFEEGDILVDWVLVAYVTNPDPEKNAMYPYFVSNGEMATYRLIGLLTAALESTKRNFLDNLYED